MDCNVRPYLDKFTWVKILSKLTKVKPLAGK